MENFEKIFALLPVDKKFVDGDFSPEVFNFQDAVRTAISSVIPDFSFETNKSNSFITVRGNSQAHLNRQLLKSLQTVLPHYQVVDITNKRNQDFWKGQTKRKEN